MMGCPVRGCDFASVSGLLVTRHLQRQHLSRNEPGSASYYRPFGGAPLTDVAEYRQKLRARTASNYQSRLRGRRVA